MPPPARHEECSYTSDHNVHAASNVSLEKLSLPTASCADVMGCNSGSSPCPVGDPLKDTLRALLYSVKDFECFVHITSSSHGFIEKVKECSDAVVKDRMVVIFEISETQQFFCSVKAAGERAESRRELDEQSMVSLVVSLQAAANTIVFYWSPTCAGYSMIINRCASGSWVCYVSNDDGLDHCVSGAKVLSSGPARLMKAVPLFYSSNGPLGMFVIGSGAGYSFSWDDLKVELEAQCRSIVQRVHRSVAPSGRCFCCQYSINLEGKLASGTGAPAPAALKVLLEPKFHQNVKSRRVKK